MITFKHNLYFHQKLYLYSITEFQKLLSLMNNFSFHQKLLLAMRVFTFHNAFKQNNSLMINNITQLFINNLLVSPYLISLYLFGRLLAPQCQASSIPHNARYSRDYIIIHIFQQWGQVGFPHKLAGTNKGLVQQSQSHLMANHITFSMESQ